VVTAGDAERASEGLRAALGLGLRGDPVQVLLVGEAQRWAGGRRGGDPRVERALGTLARLGRPARVATAEEAAAAARAARAVEVWTGSAARTARRLHLYAADQVRAELEPARGLDLRSVVEQIFEADGAVLW
jgi:hypothetical protein